MPDMATWEANLSAHCPTVDGSGMQCMICPEPATGHLTVGGGPYDGRCVAVTCPRHSSEDGWDEVKGALYHWVVAGLLDPTFGGPGEDGEPEVWHSSGVPGSAGGHWDPMPRKGHDAPTGPRANRVCIGCDTPQGEPHRDWCPVITGTLSTLPDGESGG